MQDEIVEPPGLSRTHGAREDAEEGGRQRLGRQRVGVLRLLRSTRRPHRWSSLTIFFPKGNSQVAVVASFATFGVGYVARPIGAFVLGHWGDTHGRKNVLVLCMLLMGGSTFLVAALPTYPAVGILAPILLVILRLIQGFAVGGEISGASAMILEHSPFGRRGYFGSFTLQGVQAGQIIAAAVFLPLSSLMSKETFQSGAGGFRSCSAPSSSTPVTSSGAGSTRRPRSPRRRSTERCRRRPSSSRSRRTASTCSGSSAWP